MASREFTRPNGSVTTLAYSTIPANADLTADRTVLNRCENTMQLSLWGRVFKTATDIASGTGAYDILTFDSSYAPSINKFYVAPLYSVTNNQYIPGLICVRTDGSVRVIYCPVAAETWIWCVCSWLIGT